jgi:Trk-type K+ transport system membrane component
MDNDAFYAAPSKVLLALAMLAGRLELLPMFVLFSPSSYRRRK